MIRITGPKGGARRFETDELQLFTIDGFLSDSECDDIVAIIGRHLRPSTITVPTPDKAFRISQTSDLSLIDSPVVAKVDAKIAETLGIRAPYSEGIQAQRYEAGGPHRLL